MFELRLKSNLETLMKQHRFSVRSLSQRTGVPKSTIYTWSEGRVPKNLISVYKVAVTLNVTVDFLCFGTIELQPDNSLMGKDKEQLFQDFLQYIEVHPNGGNPKCNPTLPMGRG